MGVLDGQGVNAAVTNPAFINKNINDTMPNQLGFTNPSSPSIADIQKAANDLYTATGVSETQSGTNYNATPGTIANGANYQTSLGVLAGKFDPATGHFHTGAPGDGPILDVVLSLATTGGSPQTGNIVFVPGIGIQLTQGAGFIGIAASGSAGGGVTSVAASGNTPITGAVTLSEGTGVTFNQTGNNIQINSSAAPSRVKLCYQNPSMQALPAGINTVITGWTNLILDNTSGAFDGTTFTNAVEDDYCIFFQAAVAPNGAGSAAAMIWANGTQVTDGIFTSQAANGTSCVSSILMHLFIGDTVQFSIDNAGTLSSIGTDPTSVTFYIKQEPG